MDVRRFRRFHDFHRIGTVDAEGNIVFNRIAEEEGILGDIGDIPVQHGQRDLPQRPPVDTDHVRIVRFPQALQQVHQGGLAAAGAPDHRQGFPGGHMDGYMAEGRVVLRRAGIPERQVPEFHIAPEFRHGRISLVPDLRFFVQDAADPPQGRHALAQVGNAFADGDHRPDQHAHVVIEHDELAYGDLPKNGHPPAVQQRQQQRQPDDQVQQGQHQRDEADHAQVFIPGVGVGSGKGGQFLPLLDEGLDDPDAGNRLLRLVRQGGEGLLPGQETLVHVLAEPDIPENDDDQRNQRHNRQPETDEADHADQHQHQHDGGVKGSDDRHAHQLADGAQVVGKVGHQVAGFMLVVPGHGKLFQVGEEAVSHIPLDHPGGSEQEYAPEKASHHNGGAHAQQPQGDRPDAVHGQDAVLQPVDELAGKPRDVGVDLVHQEQGSQAQDIAPPVPPGVPERQFQFILQQYTRHRTVAGVSPSAAFAFPSWFSVEYGQNGVLRRV